MIRKFFTVALVVCCGLVASHVNAAMYDISYTGTVDDTNTIFGLGAEVVFSASFDTLDLDISGGLDYVPLQDLALTIDGATQTCVSGIILDQGSDFVIVGWFWDAPPPNLTASVSFIVPGASAAFPDLSPVTLSDVNLSEINHDGAWPDPLAVSSFSITPVPEPASLTLLLGLGLGGVIMLLRRR